jgi:hypothetical protein
MVAELSVYVIDIHAHFIENKSAVAKQVPYQARQCYFLAHQSQLAPAYKEQVDAMTELEQL